MKLFICLLDLDENRLPAGVSGTYESVPRKLGLEPEWSTYGPISVLTASDELTGDPMVTRMGNWVAAGIARLDNRPMLERWAGRTCQDLTDLQLILHLIATHGVRHVPLLLGDFGLVAWNLDARTGIAACDAFSVKKLYYRECKRGLVFASRADVLGTDGVYDQRYLLELLVAGAGSPGLTPYPGVRPIAAGSLTLLEGRKLSSRVFWSPDQFAIEPRWVKAERELIDECRRLLSEAVRLRLTGDGTTWAELSGGLDSSSIVSIAQWLAQQGQGAGALGGSVTYVDRQGTGADERTYAQAVVEKWLVRNEVIVDAPTWCHDYYAPPCSDQPAFGFASYPRALQVRDIMRSSGGRVLLTGFGGDELFGGSMLYFADWLTRGRLWAALREMARLATIGRVSFWQLAYRNAVLPLLPGIAHYWRAQEHFYVAPWLRRDMLKRYELSRLNPLRREFEGRPGDKYRHAVASGIAGLARFTNYDALADLLEVRHPFLYRPLAELALRLPPELRARPHAHRWVLREAMRGILPDVVRTRVGKTDAGGFLAWSLAVRREQLLPLLRAPILGELGLVDVAGLRQAFDTALGQRGRDSCMYAEVFGTLEVEAWLQMRAGRWPSGARQSTATQRLQTHVLSS